MRDHKPKLDSVALGRHDFRRFKALEPVKPTKWRAITLPWGQTWWWCFVAPVICGLGRLWFSLPAMLPHNTCLLWFSPIDVDRKLRFLGQLGGAVPLEESARVTTATNSAVIIAMPKSPKPQDAVMLARDRAFGGGGHMTCGLKRPPRHSKRAYASAAPVFQKKWLQKDDQPAVARPVVCRPENRTPLPASLWPAIRKRPQPAASTRFKPLPHQKGLRRPVP